MAASVKMYVKAYCPYCMAAKDLMKRKGVTADITDIGEEPDKRGEMIERANGRTTVPQIFIGDRHVGGFDDLAALDDAGKLDPLLKGAA